MGADFIAIIIILIFSFFLSIHSAYHIPLLDLLPITIWWPGILILFLDIFITLNTAYYEKGEIIYDRTLIWKKWLKNSFFFDLLIFFPLIIGVLLDYFRIPHYVPNEEHDCFPYIHLTFFLKWERIKRAVNKLEE